MTRSLTWYGRRLRQMSPAEVAWRGVDQGRRVAWARRQVHPGWPPSPVEDLAVPRVFDAVLPRDTRGRVPRKAGEAVVAAADALLRGEWQLLGTARSDIADPDWFRDPVTGRRAPEGTLAFRIDHRDEDRTGNVKAVWELSRHHHLTVLATAWWLTRDQRYAETVDRQLRSWWARNPFLSGIHWTSGIELGVRLLSWVWIRRLLDEWPHVAGLFEDDERAVAQIRWHQEYLAAFRSRGSSGNNHEVLEAAGRVAAACAFPWYEESPAWRADAIAQFESAFTENTFESGVNRELATDYHRFVAETGILVAAEAETAGTPLSERTRRRLVASLDAAAALVDEAGRPPRQGDGDEGRALVLDDPAADPWALLLDLGRQTVGAQDWWPQAPAGLVGTLVGSLVAGPRSRRDRPAERPDVFADAGITILRTPRGAGPEIWCRCDGGPHGFLSIAAHGHADALSVEVRHGGTEVLVDPGTYCYHGEPRWRSYFRSTRAHNTVEVDGLDQSEEGGPFLWTTRAFTVVDRVDVGTGREVQTWTAHHDGYARLDDPVGHARTVRLDATTRRLDVDDVVSAPGRHDVALRFHLGPTVAVDLAGRRAHLTWPGAAGRVRATLDLPGGLAWTAHRGEEDPALGWYSPAFGVRVPTTTLVGRARLDGELRLRTVLTFGPRVPAPRGAADDGGGARG